MSRTRHILTPGSKADPSIRMKGLSQYTGSTNMVSIHDSLLKNFTRNAEYLGPVPFVFSSDASFNTRSPQMENRAEVVIISRRRRSVSSLLAFTNIICL